MASGNALTALLGVETDNPQVQKAISEINRIIRDSIQPVTTDIRVNDSQIDNIMRNLRILDVQTDQATRSIRGMTVAFDTAIGQARRLQIAIDHAGDAQVISSREITNVRQMEQEFERLTRQYYKYFQKVRELQNSSTRGEFDTSAIRSYEQAMDRLRTRISQLRSQMNETGQDFSRVFAQEEQYRIRANQGAERNLTNQALRQFNQLQSEALRLNRQYYTEETRLSRSAVNNTQERQRALQTLRTEIVRLEEEMRRLSTNQNIGGEARNRLSAQLRSYNNEIEIIRQRQQALISTNNSFFRNLSEGWSDAAARITNYTIVYRSLWTMIQGFHNAIDTIKELDATFTDIQMVTGYNDNQINRLADSYGNLAVQMGATTKQVAEGANEWLRQGKSVEDTNSLIEQSLIFSKVGDMETSEATEYLTSTLNGYKFVEDTTKSIGEHAQYIVDVFSKLDMEAATSSKELAVAFARTANSANDAGIPFEKLAALITTVSETTRKSATTIGESFKTISARYMNVAAGKEIDDTGETLNNVEKVLNRLGIATRNSQKEWKEFGDVIDEVGSRWKEFTSTEQSQIVTAMAGVQQAENLRVIATPYVQKCA